MNSRDEHFEQRYRRGQRIGHQPVRQQRVHVDHSEGRQQLFGLGHHRNDHCGQFYLYIDTGGGVFPLAKFKKNQ